MIQALFDRAIVARESPTADLYFQNAMQGRGATRHGPTVVASPAGTLVMRHAGRASPPQRKRLVYLADDDIPGGLADASVPRLYRQKLAMLEAPCWQRMLREADLLVASSPLIAERMRASRAEVRLLRPYWSEGFAPLDHHEDEKIDIAYLGSAVHRADLLFILPVIEAILGAEPRTHFHLAGRHLLPPRLACHPRVHRLPGRGWGEYRDAARGRRFHIALYPLLDTPFNRARSCNKLIEHGLTGAAPIYSSIWPEVRHVADGQSGLVCPNDLAHWMDAVSALIRDARGRRTVAEGAQALALRLNDPGPQRQLWTDALELQS